MFLLAVSLLFGSTGTVLAEEGKLYAGSDKYVSEDMLTVAFQTTSKGSSETEPDKAALRMVTTVDNLSYQKIGFDIKMTTLKDGKTTEQTMKHETTKVFEKIDAAAGNPEYTKKPNVFSDDSQYFATFTITGIGSSYYRNTYFTVTPYWVTSDGQTVCGITRSVMVGDAYDGIISVPVRLCSDKDTAAGMVEVTYPTDVMTYEGYYNSGSVYQEMEVNGKTAGVVKCVGNVSDIANNVKADGMYVSLRFQIARDENGKLPEADVKIQQKMFCDNKEEVVDVPGVQAKYYTFNDKE